MITVEFMRPFFTKRAGHKLRLVFAYQYFSIRKDGEVFHFIPIEGKEIWVNLEDMTIMNTSEVFVFQRGNQFVRMPLYQLSLVSDVVERVREIAEQSVPVDCVQVSGITEEQDVLMMELELMNIDNLIDKALDEADKETFTLLLAQKNKLTSLIK